MYRTEGMYRIRWTKWIECIHGIGWINGWHGRNGWMDRMNRMYYRDWMNGMQRMGFNIERTECIGWDG